MGFEERLQEYHDGQFGFIGIRAEAQVVIPAGKDHGIVQTITSGGLWGIEDDSSEDYLAEVGLEELVELKKQLTVLGFSKRAIATAFKNVEHEQR